jgi:hypothetical protein
VVWSVNRSPTWTSIGNIESVAVSASYAAGALARRAAELLLFASLDHLIRPRQQRGWDGEAEGLGGLEVDDQFNFVACPTGRSAGLAPLRILST